MRTRHGTAMVSSEAASRAQYEPLYDMDTRTDATIEVFYADRALCLRQRKERPSGRIARELRGASPSEDRIGGRTEGRLFMRGKGLLKQSSVVEPGGVEPPTS